MKKIKFLNLTKKAVDAIRPLNIASDQQIRDAAKKKIGKIQEFEDDAKFNFEGLADYIMSKREEESKNEEDDKRDFEGKGKTESLKKILESLKDLSQRESTERNNGVNNTKTNGNGNVNGNMGPAETNKDVHWGILRQSLRISRKRKRGLEDSSSLREGVEGEADCENFDVLERQINLEMGDYTDFTGMETEEANNEMERERERGKEREEKGEEVEKAVEEEEEEEEEGEKAKLEKSKLPNLNEPGEMEDGQGDDFFGRLTQEKNEDGNVRSGENFNLPELNGQLGIPPEEVNVTDEDNATLEVGGESSPCLFPIVWPVVNFEEERLIGDNRESDVVRAGEIFALPDRPVEDNDVRAQETFSLPYINLHFEFFPEAVETDEVEKEKVSAVLESKDKRFEYMFPILSPFQEEDNTLPLFH